MKSIIQELIGNRIFYRDFIRYATILDEKNNFIHIERPETDESLRNRCLGLNKPKSYGKLGFQDYLGWFELTEKRFKQFCKNKKYFIKYVDGYNEQKILEEIIIPMV